MTAANSLNISEVGFQSFDGINLFKGRTLTAGAGITISNGTGVSGNPTISASGAVGQTITGNSGGALSPTAGNWNIVTANSTVKFVGSGSTLTQDFGFPTITNLLLGSSGPSITSAAGNAGFGVLALNALVSADGTAAFGSGSLQALISGTGNTGCGHGSLAKLTGANYNIAIGDASGNELLTGSNNFIVSNPGNDTNITTGNRNIMIYGGENCTSSESDNLYIYNNGTGSESNTIRIGTSGTGSGQQSRCFLAGVLNTSSGRVIKVTTPGAYPYTTLTTDYLILVDTSSARTITPLASPVTGTTYRIKDNVGSAATNNITITPSGKNIDGAASFVINSNYGSVDIVYNGTQWNVL